MKRTMFALLPGIIAVILANMGTAAFATTVFLKEIEITEDSASVRVLCATNAPIPVECYDLTTPPQIIVDFMGEIYTNQPEIILVNKGVIKQLRMVKGTRRAADMDPAFYSLDFIIVDLKEPIRYDFSQSMTSSLLIVGKPGAVPLPPPVKKEEPAVSPVAEVKPETVPPAPAAAVPEPVKPAVTAVPLRETPAAAPEVKPKKQRRAPRTAVKAEKKPKAKFRAGKKKTAVVSDPEKRLEAAKHRKQESEKNIAAANKELNDAKKTLDKNKEGREKALKEVNLAKEKMDAARQEYDRSIIDAEHARTTAGSVWKDYSASNEQLSRLLAAGADSAQVLAAQKQYDEKKDVLEKSIAAAEQAKTANEEKLAAYNRTKAEYEEVMKKAQKADSPQLAVQKSQERYDEAKKEFDRVIEEAMSVEQELADAELALKQHELHKSEERYRRSLAELDGVPITPAPAVAPEPDKSKDDALKQALQAAEKKPEAPSAAEEPVRPKRRKSEETAVKAAERKSPDKAAERSAVELRNAGLELQKSGDLEQAMKFYQEAIMTDPKYATVHNDLGVLYEQRGLDEKAKMEYLATLKLDPNYVRAHSNLALLYEKSGEYDKAYYHWKQRAALGDTNDPWTQKAKEKLAELEQRKK